MSLAFSRNVSLLFQMFVAASSRYRSGARFYGLFFGHCQFFSHAGFPVLYSSSGLRFIRPKIGYILV
jgi:hypothetical protein